MLSATTITGRLAQAPQLRQTPTGKDVTTLHVAVSDHRLGDQPRYIDIDQWEQAAHHAIEHLTVGQEIAAEGLLDARPYTTDTGELRIGWSLARPRVEWGAKPLRDVPTERMMGEARRRREALQTPDPATTPAT
jgi:single-stranded DNA-binding protein